MANTTTLGGKAITLERPASATIVFEIAALASENRIRGFSAALGACWRGTGRPRVQYAECGHDAKVYGQRVFDELVARGLKPVEILEAGGAAVRLIMDGVVSASMVEEELGNSAAGTAEAGTG